MRLLNKKAVILAVAVITVFLLAISAAQGKYKAAFSERLITTILAPVEYAASKVGYSFRNAGSVVGQVITVYGENQSLKLENEQLKQTSLNTTEIMAENERLRAMLNYQQGAPQFDFVTAAVVARDPGTWTSTIVINRGTADGIAKDMPVVTPQGLVGNVVSVYSNSAKVQLILDPRSAVGSLVQRAESRVAAIVEGNSGNKLAPRMVNIARDADIIAGDKIITSGFGGIYPKGLLVGEVTDVINEEGGLLKYAVLKTAVDFDRLEEVLVIVRSRQSAPALPALPPGQPAGPAGQTGRLPGGLQ
ncbi:rod shape-determining protein MreC|uniref:Cell shape-determining protein MreC n=1 Tax=Dendrosporobacter quercicolus TaxID=146817 RepID=A0A1G9N1M1_9FIRM|nr:rod shape-determining protein MreC [Dendrosporobacter quercicolus]NSL47201.1 rod shape-determining protein MreC [Dendrosporobacter quercicolus DSM 1736]SDL80274.1 rod shape-determining protein MreC [Dendrosporobacter quercicolus]